MQFAVEYNWEIAFLQCLNHMLNEREYRVLTDTIGNLFFDAIGYEKMYQINLLWPYLGHKSRYEMITVVERMKKLK